MITVLDQAIAAAQADCIEQQLNNNYFPWYYLSESVLVQDRELFYHTNGLEYAASLVFRHSFVKDHLINSDFYHVIQPVIVALEQQLGRVEMEAVSANMVMPDSSKLGRMDYPHVDRRYTEDHHREYQSWTAIYYVNDCDGDTVIYQGSEIAERITPKKARLAYWDSRLIHSAPSTATSPRWVINFNFSTPRQPARSSVDRATAF